MHLLDAIIKLIRGYDVFYRSNYMKENINYLFDPSKNHKLKVERGVNFDDVVVAIEENRILELIEHHNLTKYPNQKILIVAIRGYAYQVPFTINDNTCRFITVYPSRKATARYLSNSLTK